MSRRNKAQAMSRAETAAAAPGAIEAGEGKAGGSTAMQAFSFGDPEPVLGRREIMDMIECVHNGRWYEPPIPLDGLARAYRVSPHHSSAIMLKRNLLVSSLDPTPFVTRKAFASFVQDYLVFGTAYFEQIRNVLGGPMRLEHVLAKYTRRGLQSGQFFFMPAYLQETEFAPGSIVQVMQADVNQEIYGVPEYLSALQSALLNEAATLFRRRYYLNGSHTGYILYATGDIDDDDTAALRDALKASKGPGNFKNLFVHAPGGKDGSLKILPIAEVGAKDEFLGIKNATRDDVLAAHRVPPALLGIVPAQGSSGFGNPLQATDMFYELEIAPIQACLLDVNDQVGFEAIRFKERVSSTTAAK
jgi:PBSX family phage portal protein